MIITTKFIGPTDKRSDRVIASTQTGKRETHYWNHKLDIKENHVKAASMLLEEGEKVLLSIYYDKIGYIHVTGEKFTADYLVEQITEAMK